MHLSEVLQLCNTVQCTVYGDAEVAHRTHMYISISFFSFSFAYQFSSHLGENLLKWTIEDTVEWKACVANPKSCTTLDLYNRGLTGTIPAAIGNMNLGYIDFHDNSLEGEIPSSICKPISLRTLYVSVCSLLICSLAHKLVCNSRVPFLFSFSFFFGGVCI